MRDDQADQAFVHQLLREAAANPTTHKCSHEGCEAKTEKPVANGWYRATWEAGVGERCASGLSLDALDFVLFCPDHGYDTTNISKDKLEPDDADFYDRGGWTI
jgi:hypothetical protein